MSEYAFLNGEFLPIGEAKVSIEDRGFQFGDGLFEVVRRYPQGLFELHRHLKRMAASAQKLGFALPYSTEELAAFACELARHNAVTDGELYIQATRGEAPRRHYFPENPHPTMVMTLRDTRPIPPKYRREGAAAVTFPDIRWGWCHLKSINLLPNVLAKEAAHQAGVYEALFVRDNIYLTEGASSNIFGYDGERLVTPALNNILPGVTREIVLELIAQEGFRVSEELLTVEQFLTMREAFVTSTISEVMPLVRLDENVIGGGTPGPVTKRLQQAFGRIIPEHVTRV